jgi:formate dehydrogenase subunit gamma
MNAPESALPADAAAAVTEILARFGDAPGALLPILHAVQDALSHIPRGAVPLIAAALNLSRAEVHGVVTYYPHFRSTAPGRHLVQICRAEACQAMGADRLLAHAEKVLGCRSHETRGDGAVTLEPVYCLGLCASSPALQVDDSPHARMSPARFDRLLADLPGLLAFHPEGAA